MQVPYGTGPGVRRSKRPLLASRTRCNVLWNIQTLRYTESIAPHCPHLRPIVDPSMTRSFVATLHPAGPPESIEFRISLGTYILLMFIRGMYLSNTCTWSRTCIIIFFIIWARTSSRREYIISPALQMMVGFFLWTDNMNMYGATMFTYISWILLLAPARRLRLRYHRDIVALVVICRMCCCQDRSLLM